MVNEFNPVSVSQLTYHIKEILEHSFSTLVIEGEISNFRPAASGHWYFSLKDEHAVIQAVMFRGKNSQIDFIPKDGMQVLVTGTLSVYEKRGNYQIICTTMKQAGLGQILRALEERKQRLSAEGLFDPEKKRGIPLFPKRIVAITSPTGAAIRDILNVLKRRNLGASVTILPAAVQGNEAAPQLIKMLQLANTFAMGDVIILGRGGGSLEDLLPFSDESLVRAVAESELPVISAVGHEIDWCLCDYAADLRAPTPSAAAEVVTGHREELLSRVLSAGHTIAGAMVQTKKRLALALRPFKPDFIEEAFRRVIQPRYQRLDDAKEELVQSLGNRIKDVQKRLSVAVAQIESCSPYEVLQRGYSIVSKVKTKEIITSAGQVARGEAVHIRLAQGAIQADVTEYVETAQGKELHE